MIIFTIKFNHQKVNVYDEGRVCIHCNKALSVYNPNNKCLSHYFELKQEVRECMGDFLKMAAKSFCS